MGVFSSPIIASGTARYLRLFATSRAKNNLREFPQGISKKERGRMGIMRGNGGWAGWA
jgi:hypothetical protein